MQKRAGLFYKNKKITDKLINIKYPNSNSSDLQTRGQHSKQKVKNKHESRKTLPAEAVALEEGEAGRGTPAHHKLTELQVHQQGLHWLLSASLISVGRLLQNPNLHSMKRLLQGFTLNVLRAEQPPIEPMCTPVNPSNPPWALTNPMQAPIDSLQTLTNP